MHGAQGQRLLLGGLGLKSSGGVTGVEGVERGDGGGLWPVALLVSGVLALGAALFVLLPLALLSSLNGVEDVVLDKDAQEVQRPAYFLLELL